MGVEDDYEEPIVLKAFGVAFVLLLIFVMGMLQGWLIRGVENVEDARTKAMERIADDCAGKPSGAAAQP